MSSYRDFEEALRAHGITREVLRSELITFLGSLELEDPATYREIVRDPAEIASRIRSWDFFFSTGMTTSYPARRGWNTWMALREIVQNALDIEDRTFGYDNIQLDVSQLENMMVIRNRGPGFPRDAWKLGGSDKACWERGRYGEGLKVAAAELAREGAILYLFSGNDVYKAIPSPGTDLVVIVWGRGIGYVNGTEVVIYNAVMQQNLLENMVFQSFVNNYNPTIIARVETNTKDCKMKRPNIIIDVHDRLWVADIYVNTLSAISAYPSVFSYNVWWINLEPNRINVSSMNDLTQEIAKIYTPEAVRLLLDRHFKESFAGDTEVFESTEIDWFYAKDEVKQEAAKWLEERKIAVTFDATAYSWLRYLLFSTGYVVAPVAHGRDLFTYAKSAEDMVVEHSKKMVELMNQNSNIISPAGMPILYAGRYSAILYLYARLNDQSINQLLRRLTVNIVKELDLPGEAPETSRTEGITSKNTIAITYDTLTSSEDTLSTAMHELGHYIGRQRYGSAGDVSIEFEETLTSLIGKFGTLDINDFHAIRRGLHGTILYETGRQSYTLTPRFDMLFHFPADIDASNPKLVLGMNKDGYWTYEGRLSDIEKTLRSMRADQWDTKVVLESDIQLVKARILSYNKNATYEILAYNPVHDNYESVLIGP